MTTPTRAAHAVHLGLLLAASTLPSCVGMRNIRVSDNVNQGVPLANEETEDGTRTSWRLYPGRRHDPRIDQTSSTVRFVPWLGLSVAALNRERAQAESLTPWRGVWVGSVDQPSPASRAGIAVGDVILQVSGELISSAEQFRDLIAQIGVPGEPLELLLAGRRWPPGKASAVAVVPDAEELRETSTESYPLKTSHGVQHYTGLQVAAVPPDLAAKALGTDRQVVMVSGVITGSPAYYAGLRAGDRVLSCDGNPVLDLQDVRDAVAVRVRGEDPEADTYDLLGREPGRTVSAREGDIAFDVVGPLGAHRTTVAITDDIEDETRFKIPIIVDYESDVDDADLSFLDFILQFGFNYESHVRPSATRAPAETWRLSILPFGMFGFARYRERTSYRLFWLIHFETGA